MELQAQTKGGNKSALLPFMLASQVIHQALPYFFLYMYVCGMNLGMLVHVCTQACGRQRLMWDVFFTFMSRQSLLLNSELALSCQLL